MLFIVPAADEEFHQKFLIMQAADNNKSNLSPTSLPPEDVIGQRFLQYFHHPWGFIFASVPEPGDRPAWQTETRYPLQPRNLWSHYLNPELLLGLKLGTWTRYVMTDIDRGSQYHPLNSEIGYRQVLAALEDIGLCRPVPIQSSESGGIHVYYFFSEDIYSFSLACTVCLALQDAGLIIKAGQLEIFPNPKSYEKDKPTNFKPHRLPLQAGSYLLDDDLQPCNSSLVPFLDAADWSAAGQDYPALQQAIATKTRTVTNRKSVAKLSTNAAAFKAHLEERTAVGWTFYHQTNSLLCDFGTLGRIFAGLDEEELTAYIIKQAKNAPGYARWCRHQHEIEKRAKAWARFCVNRYYPYGSPDTRNDKAWRQEWQTAASPESANNIVHYNPSQQRHRETFTRVSAVVKLLNSLGEMPTGAYARTLAIIAKSKELYRKGVSQATLHKAEYLPLWHPFYQPLPDPWDDLPACAPVSGSLPDAVSAYTSSPMKVVYALLPACAPEPQPEPLVIQTTVSPFVASDIPDRFQESPSFSLIPTCPLTQQSLDASYPVFPFNPPSPLLYAEGQTVQFWNYGQRTWTRAKISKIVYEQGYFVYLTVYYWAFGKIRRQRIDRDDWIRPYNPNQVNSS